MKHALLLLLVLAPATALADAKSEAKAHVEKAMALHGSGKLKEALDELTLAYQLDARPELLYAMGQVHVQLGDCAQAISFYERFLATKPGAAATTATKEAIQTCKSMPAPEPAPVQTPEPAPEPVPPPEPAAPPPPPPRTSSGTPWYKDVIGDALVGGGVVAGVLSVVFYRQMSGKLDDADAATTYAEHEAARDAASSRRSLSIASGVGGAVLIGAGVARYMFRDSGERSSKVAVTPTTDGGLITVMGRF